MKNTVRVRNHRKPQPAKVQAQTPGRTVRLSFQDSHGKPFAEFDIPKVYYDAIVADASKTGISLSAWVEDAIVKSTPAPAPARAFHVDFNQLEDAKNQSNALLTLLAERIEFQSLSDSSGGENTGEFAVGILHLISQTNTRLNAAVADLHQDIIRQKNEVAE